MKCTIIVRFLLLKYVRTQKRMARKDPVKRRVNSVGTSAVRSSSLISRIVFPMTVHVCTEPIIMLLECYLHIQFGLYKFG